MQSLHCQVPEERVHEWWLFGHIHFEVLCSLYAVGRGGWEDDIELMYCNRSNHSLLPPQI